MKNETENVKKVENLLQFTTTLGMFFPVLLEAVSNLGNSDIKEAHSIVLKAGFLIFILIANYLFFEWRKNKLKDKALNYLSWTFYATIACYGLVFLFLSFIANGDITSASRVMEYAYGFVLIGSIYIPLVSIVIMVINIISEVKSEVKKISQKDNTLQL